MPCRCKFPPNKRPTSEEWRRQVANIAATILEHTTTPAGSAQSTFPLNVIVLPSTSASLKNPSQLLFHLFQNPPCNTFELRCADNPRSLFECDGPRAYSVVNARLRLQYKNAWTPCPLNVVRKSEIAGPNINIYSPRGYKGPQEKLLKTTTTNAEDIASSSSFTLRVAGTQAISFVIKLGFASLGRNYIGCNCSFSCTSSWYDCEYQI